MKKITFLTFLFLFPLLTLSQTPYEAHINFQNDPASTTPPTGYLADYGREFGFSSFVIDATTYQYGWFQASNDTPINATGNGGVGRNRIAGTYAGAPLQDQLEGTLVHFQGDNIGSWAGQNRGNELYWELEIPNGTYEVTIGLGDKSSSVDSRHSATVEGFTIIPAFAPTPTETRLGTMIVSVTDGRLTINGLGGFNSKITHIDVTESTGTPVSGVLAFSPNTTSETLESGAAGSFNADLSGAGAGTLGMIIDDNETASNDWLTLPGTLALGTLNFVTSATGIGATETRDDKIIATATGFTPAELDADLTVTAVAPTFPLQVNFQDQGTTPPAGYLKDYGLPYGPNEGGLVYGWIKLSDGLPIDLTTPSSGVGRNRGDFPSLDLLQETLVHMQGNDIGSWTGNRSNEGVWEVDVPNGWYEVVVSVGDPNQDGQVSETPDHFIRAEGQTVIPIYDVDSNLPNGDPGRFTTGTLVVEVTDGKLTIDADDPGANNTKINSVVISESSAPLSTETDILSFTLLEQTGGASIDAINHTVDIEVANGTGLGALTPTIGLSAGATINPLSDTQQDFNAPFDYTVTAEDATTTQVWTVTVTEATGGSPYQAHINFQDNPSSTTPPTGYLADYGKEFGNASVTVDATTYQYGWKLLADGTPIDVSDEAANNSVGVGRNRIAATYDTAALQDQLEGTLVHFQGDNIAGWPDGQPRKNELFWEIEIPNGIYEVTLGLGDKSTSTDSRHSATIEGYTIIPAFVPTATETRVATMIVEVTDGLLTMNGLGGFNSKITHIDIVESTGTPVSGVLAFSPNTTSESLGAGSTGSFSADLAGAGATTIGMIIDENETESNDWLTLPATYALGQNDFAMSATALVENDTRASKIIATAAGFTPAILDADLTVTAIQAAFLAQINFQDNAVTPPAGYAKDYGKEFGNASITVDVTDYQYGWKLLADGTPFDASDDVAGNSNGVGRNRLGAGYASATPQDQLEGSLVHFQGDNIAGWAAQPRGNELFWEMEIPNGIYDITLGLGDTSTSVDSRHSATVEGISILPATVAISGEVRVTTMTVEVTDGLLTINGLGGFNTKITHLIVASSTNTPVNGVLGFSPNTFSESLGTGATGSFASDLAGAGAIGIEMIIDDVIDPFNDWLTLPATITLGTLNFATDATTLLENDTRSDKVIATAAGFAPAVLDADLTVTAPVPTLSFDVSALSFTGGEGETIAPQTVNLSASSGTPTIVLADDPDSSGWLIIPSVQQLGALEFGIQPNLPVGTYTTNIMAIDQPDQGYVNAEMTVSLEITEVFDLNVNFSDAATAPPSGYEQDSGLPYGLRANGFTYGWLETDGSTPVDLSANARNRGNGSVTLLQNTLIHMQYGDTGGTNGNSTEGIWEVEVPNGIYDVSVSVGDPSLDGPGTEPLHTINVEGTQIIDQYSPTGAAGDPGRFTSASTTVSVNDGKLTIDASGGFNTKITNIEIVEAVGVQAPQVVGVIPADGSANISVNASISANNLFLPNFDTNGVAGVNNSTITNSTVKLFKQGTTVQVGATVNGTGGGDAINLQPNLPLEANTTYIFEIDGVEDTTGIPFEFFTSTFTTGNGNTGGNTDLDNVSFTNAGTVETGVKYSTLTIGPDGKLYGLSINGDIHRWDINADGTLANEETLTAWKAAYGSRTSVGLVFDPDATAGNLIAYITHNSGGLSNAPAWDGKISRLTGANLQIEDLVVTNLPRSKRDHLTNSMAFKPGEPNVIYFNQGSNSAAGAPDNAWGNRKERLLSAAALRLDLDLLPEAQWPLNAKTTMDPVAINAIDVNSPTLVSTVGTFTEDNQSFPDDGTYNPFYVNAPLTLFADGVRNAYDLLWHTNGQLYIPTNGTAGGSNAPASIDGTRRPDGTFYNHADPDYPPISASNNNNVQRDWLFRINPASGIGYYGHPNPLRGEFVLNRGDADVNNAVYNGVVADVNYRGAAFDFEFNKSPNGVIEYRSNAENGNLQGAILVVRYSGGSDIIAMVPDGPNGDVATSKIGIPGFTGFQDPLDLVEDVSTGNIYVSDYGRSEIVLLKPSNQASPQPVIALGTDQVTGDAVTAGTNTYTEQVVISNLGNAVLNNISHAITGADAAQFSVTGLPTSLNAQNSDSFDVIFDPTSNGPKFAILTISGTDADDKVIALHGLGKAGTGGSNEPSLQWILDTHLGTGVVSTGDTNAATNIIDLPGGTTYNDLLGDEVAEDSFERAVDAPVTIEVLSVYGPEANNPIVGFGWYPTGDATTTNELFTIENTTANNGQTLNPIVNGLLEFDPGVESFGFYNRWPFFGDRHLYSEDALNTFSGAIPHHIRVYEVPGEQDAYIIATEEHIAGFDYQDIVVLVRNIRPANNTPTIDLVKINFSRAIDAPPAGYLKDSGEGFADRGNGFSYGWLTTDGQTPLDLTSNTRNRELGGVDILQNTLNHMQYGDTGGGNGVPTEGIWEIAVPNGVYDVSVGVGDPDVDGTNTMYTINVEGTNIINNFVASGAAGAATRFTSGSTTVSVVDGRLTIDAFGGFNTKINSLEIVQVGNSNDPIITASFDGTENAPDVFRGPVQVTLEVQDQSGSGITLFEYQLDSDPLVPYSTSFTVSDIGAHVLVVNAEDADGNTTQEIYNFTIEAPTGAIVSIENMMKIPGTNRGFPAEDYFTFYRHRNPGAALVHDSNVLRINNTGTGDLTVTDVVISDTGAYSYVILPSGAEPVSLPISIAAGASRDLEISFIADPGGGNNAIFKESIQIVSNADNGLDGTATLHGGFTPQPEGGDEINAQEVFDVFGFKTSMLSIVNDSGTISPPNASPTNPSSNFPDPANIDAGYEGDMIYADAFVQADPSQPVRGLQLSALHGGPSINNARFVEIGNNNTVAGMSFFHADNHYQTLLPEGRGPVGTPEETNGTGVVNSDVANTVSLPFRIAVAGLPSDGGSNTSNSNPELLGVRIYKVLDRDGNIVPNEYLVLQDFIGSTGCGAGSANCDWNDNTFYFINIRPQAVPTAQPLADFPAEIDVPFSIDFLSAFDKGYAGNILTFEATYQGGALPAWITFDPDSGTLEGTAPTGTSGTFDVLITATDVNGLTASTTQNIIVGDNEAPVAVASATPESGQAALVVQFTGSNSTDDNNDIVSYLWDFGDTNTSNEADPEHTFTSAGIYEVSLTVTDGGSLTDVANVTITVSSPPNAPVAIASSDISSGDAPLTVNFTGSNSTDASSYSWDFDDGGATSTSADTQHTFNSPGIYNVVLTATGSGGSDTANIQITVSDPNADYELRINAGGPQVTFNSEVFEADQNFVGGKVYTNASAEVPELYQTERSANPPAIFDYAIPLEDGQYNITLHFAEIYWGATGGGPLTSEQRIFDVVMEGITILDDYDINADVGPQTPVTKTFPVTMTDGVLNLTFDASGPNGVNQPKLSAIEIVGSTTAAEPVAVAEADVEEGDAPLTVNFTGSNSTDTTSYSWDFDDDGASSTEANPEHTFTAPGVYNVVLTVNGPGGTDTANVQITVNTPANAPVAVATSDVNNGDAPLTVNFTGSNSTDTTGFSWDFDDAGASSNLANPQHTFNSPGIYNVVLTATGPGGTDTANVQITVTDPASDFALRINAGGPQLIHNSEVFVADQNFDGGRSYTNAAAEVADLYKTERSSNQREFDYNIPVPNGEYQVILHFAEIYWGATGGGALGTSQRVFDVTMEGNLILDDYDINADVGPQTEVTKTFPVTMTDGTLNLNFDATGLNGVDQPKLSAIEIIGTLAADPPVAVASSDITVGEAPLTVNFTGSNSTDTSNFSWDFDDGGANSVVADPQHTFNTPGIYNVVLTVTGPGGSDTANVQITVNDPVNDFALRINAGGPQLTHNNEVFEADQNFDGGRAFTNAAAEVADLYKTERSSNQRTFDYNIPLPNGDYQVILHFAEIYWGATGGGALGTSQRVFDVTMEGNLILDDYNINADVGPQTEVTKTFPVTMTDGTLNLNFDATGINGVDQPKLSAIEIIGNTTSTDPPVAIASADVSNGDPDLTVNFTGSNSTNTTSFSWDFDDGNGSTLADPQHVFTAPGVYDVVLTVTGPGGSDTESVQITVNDPVASFVKRINAGGPALSHSGLLFETDQNFDGGRSYSNAAAEVADLYKTERSSNQREFDYNVPLADGQYEVILHFAEIYWGATGGGPGGAGSRIFDVSIEGTTLLDDYDINVDVGPQTEVTKSFIVTVSDGTLNLAFNALDPDGVDQPKLSAMEILGIVSGSGAKENSDAVSAEAEELILSADLAKDPVLLLGVRIYPNPAVDEINIEVSNATNGISEFLVHDMLGRLVATYKASDLGNGNTYLLPIHSLEGGMYNIVIVDGKGFITSERLIVKD